LAAAARYSVTSPNLESSLRGAPIRHTRRVPPRGNRAKPQDPCQPHPRTKFGDLKMPPKLVRKSGSAHSTISPTCFPAGMTASELASACLPKSECDTHARCRQKRFAYQRSLRILIPPYGGSNPGAPASRCGLYAIVPVRILSIFPMVGSMSGTMVARSVSRNQSGHLTSPRAINCVETGTASERNNQRPKPGTRLPEDQHQRESR
jgi:hypothetical protein